MNGSLAGTHHSMSTQISRQTTNEDILDKRVGLGKITTKDASSQLPEVSKGLNGWNTGKNTGQKRNRPSLNEKAFVKVKPKQPGKVKPKQPGKDDLLKLGVCFVLQAPIIRCQLRSHARRPMRISWSNASDWAK
jgi:hypothetical protein